MGEVCARAPKGTAINSVGRRISLRRLFAAPRARARIWGHAFARAKVSHDSRQDPEAVPCASAAKPRRAPSLSKRRRATRLDLGRGQRVGKWVPDKYERIDTIRAPASSARRLRLPAPLLRGARRAAQTATPLARASRKSRELVGFRPAPGNSPVKAAAAPFSPLPLALGPCRVSGGVPCWASSSPLRATSGPPSPAGRPRPP